MGVGGDRLGGFWAVWACWIETTEYTEYTEGFLIVGVSSWSSRIELKIVG